MPRPSFLLFQNRLLEYYGLAARNTMKTQSPVEMEVVIANVTG